MHCRSFTCLANQQKYAANPDGKVITLQLYNAIIMTDSKDQEDERHPLSGGWNVLTQGTDIAKVAPC